MSIFEVTRTDWTEQGTAVNQKPSDRSGPGAINFAQTLNRTAAVRTSGRTWARALVESHQPANPTLPLPSPRGSQTGCDLFCLVPYRLTHSNTIIPLIGKVAARVKCRSCTLRRPTGRDNPAILRLAPAQGDDREHVRSVNRGPLAGYSHGSLGHLEGHSQYGAWQI